MMVSKKEIENECNGEIEEAQKEIDKLEEKHKSFIQEDETETKRIQEEKGLSNKLDLLRDKSYLGNWGKRDNWYNGRIPDKFLFDESDSETIKKALTEIYHEKENEIVEGKEYKKLLEEKEKIEWNKFSKTHSIIHKKIIDLKEKIRWNESRIESIQTRGGLLILSKIIAEQKRYKEKNKIKEEKIKKYKAKILSMGEL